MYDHQHKVLQSGGSLPWRLAVDYDETHVGTSLAHFLASADDVFEQDGRLAFMSKDTVRQLGCVIHAQGQSGSLIEKDIQLQLATSHKAAFTAKSERRVDLLAPFARLRIH